MARGRWVLLNLNWKVIESTHNVEQDKIIKNVLYVPPTLTMCPTCSGWRTRSDEDQITIKFPWPPMQYSTHFDISLIPRMRSYQEWDQTENQIETEHISAETEKKDE